MRTLLIVLISFILVFALQQCNNSDENLVFNKTVPVAKDSLNFDEIKCKPCCNNGIPGNCDDYINGISLAVGNPPYEICVACQCCIDIWEYYEGDLPDVIPENIVNIVGCDETKINE